MFRFLLVIWMTLLPTQLCSQSQTIKSVGDHNTNTNQKGFVNVVVSVSPETKTALRVAARNTFGNSNLWQGLLVPADDKLPDSCTSKIINGDKFEAAPPKTILEVRAGGNTFRCTHLPCNIARTNEDELLAIDGKPGAIMVEAKIRDKDGDIIASVEKSRFYVNPNRTYRPPIRDNKSSLKVLDMKGNIVLEVRYANRHTLLVRQAIFNTGDSGMLTIDPTHIQIDSFRSGRYHQKISGECDVQVDDEGHSGYFSEQFGNFFFGGSPK